MMQKLSYYSSLALVLASPSASTIVRVYGIAAPLVKPGADIKILYIIVVLQVSVKRILRLRNSSESVERMTRR